MARPFCACLTVGVAALVAAGCQSLQPVNEPARFITETKPDIVYVTQGSGAIVELVHPQLQNDTLVGRRPGYAVMLSLPWRQVERISTVRRDKGRTIALVGGVTIATALTAYAIFNNSNGHHDLSCDFTTRALEMNAGAPICGPISR